MRIFLFYFVLVSLSAGAGGPGSHEVSKLSGSYVPYYPLSAPRCFAQPMSGGIYPHQYPQTCPGFIPQNTGYFPYNGVPHVPYQYFPQPQQMYIQIQPNVMPYGLTMPQYRPQQPQQLLQTFRPPLPPSFIPQDLPKNYHFVETLLKGYTVDQPQKERKDLRDFIAKRKPMIENQWIMNTVAIHGLWPNPDYLSLKQASFDYQIVHGLEISDPFLHKELLDAWISASDPTPNGCVDLIMRQWNSHGRQQVLLTQREYMLKCLQLHKDLNLEVKLKNIAQILPSRLHEGTMYFEIEFSAFHLALDLQKVPKRIFKCVERNGVYILKEMKFALDTNMKFDPTFVHNQQHPLNGATILF